MKFPRYKPLSKQAELEVVLAAKGGCDASFEKLVASIWPMAIKAAYREANVRGWNNNDEIEIATLGAVWKCLNKFDTTRGWRFTTLLSWYVRHEIQYEYGRTRAIVSPLTHILKKRPGAVAMSIDVTTPEGRRTFADTIVDHRLPPEIEEEQYHLARRAIFKVLGRMEGRKATIVRMRLLEGATLQATAEVIGVTKECVRQYQKSLEPWLVAQVRKEIGLRVD